MCVCELESRRSSVDACAFSRRVRFHECGRNRESGHLREELVDRATRCFYN